LDRTRYPGNALAIHPLPDNRYCFANNNPNAEGRCEYHVALEHRERYAALRSTAASFRAEVVMAS
jgi:hypothetical protein